MTMINIITSIFNPKVVVELHNDAGEESKFLQITEDGEYSDIKRLFVRNLPNDCFAISLDVPQKKLDDNDKIAYSRLNHYFNKTNSSGLNKKCDLIIFANIDDNEYIVIFDLKSKDPNPEASAKQLMSSEVYVRYVLDVATTFYEFDKSNVKLLKIIGSTRIRKSVSHIDAERIEKVKRRKAAFDSSQIKEVSIIKNANNNGSLNFNEMIRFWFLNAPTKKILERDLLGTS